MTKLTDAQIATLTRGAQHPNGFISPAPKTPMPMAMQAANKLSVLGLVELAPCFHDEPWYQRNEDTGDCEGYRITADGCDAIGIDPSEWPKHLAGALALRQAADQRRAAEPANEMPKEWEAPGPTEQDMARDEDAADRAGYIAEQESELAADDTDRGFTNSEPEDMAEDPAFTDGPGPDPLLDPVVTGAELAASMGGSALPEPLAGESNALAAEMLKGWAEGARASLRDAAAAFLAAWDADGGPMDTTEIGRAVERLRAAMPAAKAAKVAGAVSAPREGSKMALVIGLLERPGGATAAQVMDATGWNNTSTRGFISSLRVKRGLAVETAKIDGATRYWIGAANAPELPAASAAAKPAKAGTQPAF